MRNRTKARECALKILYAVDVRKDPALECAGVFWESHSSIKGEIKEFSAFLVDGVVLRDAGLWAGQSLDGGILDSLGDT